MIGITTALQWESSDAAVAAVDENGLVTAIAPGTAQVSVAWDGQHYDCSVTVTAANVMPAAEDNLKNLPADDVGSTRGGTLPADGSDAGLLPLLE